MLAVILKILSILGIILLVLLGISLVIILLVLFFPIIYRINAGKNEESVTVNGRANWLFGLFRVSFIYPEPGKLIVKLLWFTLYDSSKSKKDITTTEVPDLKQPTEYTEEEKASPKQEMTKKEETDSFTDTSEAETKEEPKPWKEKLFAKFEKIKYTIRKIYDKIKHILENISFYKELLQDDDTKNLISHAWKRLGKILKSIRPRKLETDIVFGMNSPDVTGYVFGLYGMLSPRLGKDVVITPDFTQQILEGNVYAAGHFTIFTLLIHLLAVLFDKRLWLLKERLDAHKQKMKQKT